MYLTSFVHRDELFDIAERWLGGRLEPFDALRLTEILICDGFIVGETLGAVTGLMLEALHGKPIMRKRVQLKGELRDAVCSSRHRLSPRVEELFRLYRENPDFFYREAPINGMVFLDAHDCFIGAYRVKRPRRIAEKSNRRIANWIFNRVKGKAREMAEARARALAIPVEWLITPEREMVEEFVRAEESIAQGLSNGVIRLDRSALSIDDVGGLKIVVDDAEPADIEGLLPSMPQIRVIRKKEYQGDYRAIRLILGVEWDREHICRRFLENEGWKRYLRRGIPEETLKKGLEPLIRSAEPVLNLELILTTFSDMVESELGKSIHEERIIVQRDSKLYKGYIPLNVELLVEYLFEVGFCPRVQIDGLPIKLCGRYLPDAILSRIRDLYDLPKHELFD